MGYEDSNIDSILFDKLKGFITGFRGFMASSGRATVRFFRYLPWRIRNYVQRRIKEYKNRPPRKDINRVYVLVGYTTKESVDARYVSERRLIMIRRGLMAIILILILFISVDRIFIMADFGEISHVFGINSIQEITENDPFEINPQDKALPTPVVIQEETAATSTGTGQ
ncbi:hypothetical protein SAMN02910456_00236 [Ruminococcaceae bacterium YRB3002]|nr:hypothetical protein SAMN02910456_00236 [Ruminococcaceae bacterium YRB3002]